MLGIRELTITRWPAWLGLAAVLAVSGLAAPPAWSADEKKDERPRKTKVTSTIRLGLQKRLAEAEKLAEGKKFEEAVALLRKSIENTSKLTEFERFQLRNFSGYVYYQMGNYDKALVEYKEISTYEGVDSRFAEDATFTVAQLYQLLNRTDEALKVALRLEKIKSDKNDASLKIFIAQLYYTLERFKQGLPYVKRAISLVKSNKPQVSSTGEELTAEEIHKLTTPRKSWYQLLHAYLYELKRFKEMLAVDMEWAFFYPENDTLMYLVQSLGLLERQKDQLSVLELLYERGYLDKEQYLVTLAQLMVLHGVPYKAADLIERQMKAGVVDGDDIDNLVLLSRAWVEAKEERKSIPPLRKAASLSERGREYEFLARSHINLFQWPEAEKALRNAIKKGELANEHFTHISLGQALAEQRKYKESQQTLERVVAKLSPEINRAANRLQRAQNVKGKKRNNKKIKALRKELAKLRRQLVNAKQMVEYVQSEIKQRKYLFGSE